MTSPWTHEWPWIRPHRTPFRPASPLVHSYSSAGPQLACTGTVPVNTGNHTGTCSAPRDELPIRIHTDPQAHSEAGLLSSSIAIERHRAAQEDAAALLATPRDLDPWTQSLRPADLLSLAAEDGIQPAPPGLPWIHTVTRTWAGPAPSSHLTLFPNSHLVRRLCGGAENCRNLSGI